MNETSAITDSHDLSLQDRFGRKVTYVRISITDRCDFRCLYCMSEEMEFLPRTQILTLEEIFQVSHIDVSLVGGVVSVKQFDLIPITFAP